MHARIPVVALLLLTTAGVRAEDTPEQVRQKLVKKNQDALLSAAKQGDAQQVRGLLRQGTDVNARDGSQRTALLHASRNGHLAAVRALLEAKPDLDARDPEGNTALMEAAKRRVAMPATDL